MPTNYWWVNHRKKHLREIQGGYIWCPQRTRAEAKKQTYENLTRTKPGDIVLSYANASIRAIGVVTAQCIESSRPVQDIEADDIWGQIGWYVAVRWTVLDKPVVPKQILEQLLPLLPETYSPLQKNGKGAENTYLAKISDVAYALILKQADNDDNLIESQIEGDAEEIRILGDESLTPIQRFELSQARRGQGKYKKDLQKVDKACRITGVSDIGVLIASHAKPWCKCAREEQLDPNNGLLLAPHIDYLFDRFLISFDDDGRLLTAGSRVDRHLLTWGIDVLAHKAKEFKRAQLPYIQYHRARHHNKKIKGDWA